MDHEKLPRKPAIPSLTSAISEINAWLSKNRYERLKDSAGLEWSLNAAAEKHGMRVPPDHEKLWELRLSFEVDVTSELLIKTGTLSEKEDERLISLVGEDVIPIRMRPLRFFAHSEEELRSIMIEELPKIRDRFQHTDLTSLKRTLVGRWVDERGQFNSISTQNQVFFKGQSLKR